MRILLMVLFIGLVVCVQTLVAVEKPLAPQKFGIVEKGDVPDSMSLKGGLYLYVYDDEKKVWNRAREETLRTAACENIRAMSMTTVE